MSKNLKHLIPTARQEDRTRNPIREQIGKRKHVYYNVKDFSNTQFIINKKFVYQL